MKEKLFVSRILVVFGVMLSVICFSVWFIGSSNPYTPAGYSGYLTTSAIFGSANFKGIQQGPVSPGRSWLTSVINVSITPYTFTEDFLGEDDAVLAEDNLKVRFRSHIVWRINNERVKNFVEGYSTLEPGDHSDKVVKTAYGNYIREPFRTLCRSEIARKKGLAIKGELLEMGQHVHQQMIERTKDTPFDIMEVVMGGIQYPPEVANEVANKLAATQVLERKQTDLAITEMDGKRRVAEARGIAEAMNTIKAGLTGEYLQYLAIEAQKAMVGSPNHTTIYLPVGPMGVPLTGTFPIDSNHKK